MFRFTIRDVLWLTVVVALAVGWWVDDNALRKRLATQARETDEMMEQAIRRLEHYRRKEKAESLPSPQTGSGFPGNSLSNGFPGRVPIQAE